MRIHALSIVLGLAATGCDLPLGSGPDTPVDVVLVTDAGEYHQGATAKVVLRNDGDVAIFYNTCHSAREVRTATGWRRMSPLRVCTAGFSELRPGAEVEFEESITSEWTPGLYRMVIPIHVDRRQHEIFSATFEVRE